MSGNVAPECPSPLCVHPRGTNSVPPTRESTLPPLLSLRWLGTAGQCLASTPEHPLSVSSRSPRVQQAHRTPLFSVPSQQAHFGRQTFLCLCSHLWMAEDHSGPCFCFGHAVEVCVFDVTAHSLRGKNPCQRCVQRCLWKTQGDSYGLNCVPPKFVC